MNIDFHPFTRPERRVHGVLSDLRLHLLPLSILCTSTWSDPDELDSIACIIIKS